MKHISILILVFILCNSFLLSQENTSNPIDNDKSKFETDVFKKEFGDTKDTTDQEQKLYDKIPEELPDWALSPIQNNKYFVGYSDPNMENEEAIQQAILRAKALFVLMNYSTVSVITDDYTNLKESGSYSLYITKYQDFLLSKAQLAYNNSSVVVLDTFFTKYNEGIVMIEFNYEDDSIENKDTILVKGEHLQVFNERNNKNEKIEFFNFSIQDNLEKDSVDLISQYNYKIINRRYDISSIFGNKIIEFKERTYNYRTNLDFVTDSTDSDLNFFRLSRGLWNGYVTGVLSNITTLSQYLSTKVKNSNDSYTLKNEGLIRTIARNKLVFELLDFKMYENQFYIDLNGRIVY